MEDHEQQTNAQQSVLYRIWSMAKGKLSGDAPIEDLLAEEASPAKQEMAPQGDEMLRELWEKTAVQEKGEFVPIVYVPEEMDGTDEPRYKKELDIFRLQLRQLAEATLNVEPNEDGSMTPINGFAQVRVSFNKMKAWLYLFPPQFGGNRATREDLFRRLGEEGVTYGLDADLVAQIADQGTCFRLFTVARGLPPQNGKDGEIVDCIPRESELKIQENEHGNVDYKSTGLIRNIQKGAVICKILPPTDPVSGVDIMGNKVNGRPGKPAIPPRGSNTELNADGTELIASADGHIVFQDNQFTVQKVLVISGDVDNTIGNLDFQGDIQISGDVREGFRIKAKGNVFVSGMVEDAVIISGSSITIEKGMNGNGHGLLDAQKDINCKYVENCTVYAKGKISAGSIICSNIFCDDTLDVRAGKGVIIGGNCTVFKLIEARTIGSRSDRITNIVLGNTPSILSQKSELETRLRELREAISEIEKNLSYIDTRNADMTPRQKAVVGQMRLKKPLLMIQEKQAATQLEEVRTAMDDVSNSRIRCDTVFPVTKITIGKATTTVESQRSKCNIYYAEGEVVIGSQ